MFLNRTGKYQHFANSTSCTLYLLDTKEMGFLFSPGLSQVMSLSCITNQITSSSSGYILCCELKVLACHEIQEHITVASGMP